MKPQTVAVIDDEPQIRKLLRIALEAEGYRVLEAASGQEGLVVAATRRPDAVILDLGLPDRDGIAVIRDLRGWTSMPILVLSARQDPEDKVQALDLGADDYVTKPFDTTELLARVRVLLRRQQSPDEPVVECGPLRVDLPAQRVHAGGQRIDLTSTEFALLRCLARNAGKVVTQRQLLGAVWGPQSASQALYLRVFLARSAASSPRRASTARFRPSRGSAIACASRHVSHDAAPLALYSLQTLRFSNLLAQGRTRGILLISSPG